MIDGFKLTEELVQLTKGFSSWEDAIRFSAKPLVEGKFIEETYVDAMISSVKEYGPYIVIAPNIAMPHARPEAGSLKVGFAVTLCEDAVAFGETEDTHARLMVTLSCVSADTHLKMIQALVDVLGDPDKMELILKATTKEELLKLFS